MGYITSGVLKVEVTDNFTGSIMSFGCKDRQMRITGGAPNKTDMNYSFEGERKSEVSIDDITARSYAFTAVPLDNIIAPTYFDLASLTEQNLSGTYTVKVTLEPSGRDKSFTLYDTRLTLGDVTIGGDDTFDVTFEGGDRVVIK